MYVQRDIIHIYFQRLEHACAHKYPIILVYAKVCVYIYIQSPYHMCHMYTLKPPPLICTSRPYHTCAHRNSIIAYVSVTLVPTGMYTQTCHRYTHCTYDHRDTICVHIGTCFMCIHRDLIMCIQRCLITHMYTETPSCMHLRNSITYCTHRDPSVCT